MAIIGEPPHGYGAANYYTFVCPSCGHRVPNGGHICGGPIGSGQISGPPLTFTPQKLAPTVDMQILDALERIARALEIIVADDDADEAA